MENQKYDARNKVGLGLYHLDPRWTLFDEFEWMVDRGYLNSFILSMQSFGTTLGAAQKIAEIGGQIWLDCPPYYSAKESLSDYMKQIGNYINKLKDRGGFDNVIGFHWDEPLLHPPHTNADLLAMTKAIAEEYGLRIFPVFSAYEVMGRKGNWNDPEGTLILESDATKYLTDIGYDCYGYDFRIPSTQAMQNKIKSIGEIHPEITSTETYYKCYIDRLKSIVENKRAKIWVFPCTYTVYTWGDFVSDEDYCIAHLKGLTKLLLEQENPGGIFGYTFKSWYKNEPGMDKHLSRYNPERWEKFENALREVYAQIMDIEIK